MANDTKKIKLPREVVTELLNKAKDTSTIAKLSPSKPQKFVDINHMIFNPSSEAEVVEEGAKKGSYELDFTPIEGKRVKVVTTTRVSDELRWADEDNKMEIVDNILADQNAAIGRSLDYVVYHAVNPKGGSKLVGYTALTANATSVTSGESPVEDIDKLVDASWTTTSTASPCPRSTPAPCASFACPPPASASTPRCP